MSTVKILPVEANVSNLTSYYFPDKISEESELNGWALSTLNHDNPIKMDDKIAIGKNKISFKSKQITDYTRHRVQIMRLAVQNLGSPLVNDNYIEIQISGANASHGSEAKHISLHFGDGHTVILLGRPNIGFPAGDTLRWDFNTAQPFMEKISTDAWDELLLENRDKDGIKMANVKIVHSGETILDWSELTWLDNSMNERHRFVSLTAQILQKKLEAVDHNWIAQIHWAAREIGKTDSLKYGTANAWCSEFASWALRKGGWNTPQGDFGSQSMENYFSNLGRAHQQSEIMSGSYVLNPGDYLRFQWTNGTHHSGIFMKYIDDPSQPTTNTRIKTIEGNTAATVRVRTRLLRDLLSCGNTK